VIAIRANATALGKVHAGRLRIPAWIAGWLALAVTSWPVLGITAGPGLDPSWRIALHMAASRGLDFGREVVFTYGPLGFLSQPVFVTPTTGLAALLFVFVAHLGLCAVMLRSLLRTAPPVVAIVAVGAIMSVVAALRIGFPLMAPEYVVVGVFFLAVWMIEREVSAPPWALVAGGALTAFELLVKINGGLVCFLVLLIAAWFARPTGLWSELIFIGSFAGAFVALWLLTGNKLADVPEWLRLSGHTAASYTGAMATESGARVYEYGAAAVVVLMASAALVLHARTMRRARALALVAVSAIYAFAYFKEGFVRHDVHALIFFAAMAMALLAFQWRDRAAVTAAAAVVIAVVSLATGPELGGTRPFHPRSAAVALVSEFRQVATSARRQKLVDSGKHAVRRELGLSPSVLTLVRGHGVDVGPYETSAAWAYDLDWRPQPLLQQYTVMDETLDRFNADQLERSGAARVLRQLVWPAVDGKHPLFEAPQTFMSLLCSYRELLSSGGWDVLARGPNRCGRPRLLQTVSGRPGDDVAIPRAPGVDDVVFARIWIRQTLTQRVAKLLLKLPHQPEIRLDGERYRLVASTATGPLILRMPRAAGMSASAGGAVDYNRLSLVNLPSYRVQFYALRLRRQWRSNGGVSGALRRHSVTFGHRTARLVSRAIAGHLDTATVLGGAVFARGWAGDTAAKVPADAVLVFQGRRLLAYAHVAGTGDYIVTWPLGASSSPRARPLPPIRVVAILGRRASFIGKAPAPRSRSG
jgi:hypothetical protein